MTIEKQITKHEIVWNTFIRTYDLNDQQSEQMRTYLALLLEWNTRINLTAITSVPDAISYHLADSLPLSNIIDMHTVFTLCDVGTGGGLPGIPLAIAYPHLKVILVEVVGKKIDFLNLAIEKLGLQDRVQVIGLDWRTFVRSTDYPIDVVCARASLRPDELIRMFGGTSPYANAQLVYWASSQWQLQPKEQKYFKKDVMYQVGEKQRRLMLFAK